MLVQLVEKPANEITALAQALLIPEVLKHLPDHWQPVTNAEAALNWLNEQQAIFHEIQYQHQPAGLVLIHQPTPDTWYLGFMLLPKFWGQGIASTVVKQVQTLAQQAAVKQIVAGASADNIASQKLLEKCGFALSQSDDQVYAQWVPDNGVA
ncbi:GNAT family N-acetyltransferase [Salinibius halmophilus]|uniref:GNAT family N-acetyltransferase n=1 Tax=Salinibius halmophilus TaxID=1853216 RepID=UPI000E673C38|nr:GNAT family N-acetyltransferase [Salinibius halmophilus]